MNSGKTKWAWADSLSAFWSGLQVLIGDIEGAKQTHQKYYELWKRYVSLRDTAHFAFLCLNFGFNGVTLEHRYGVGIPERFDVIRGKPVFANYPLRPEFVESTYFLYLATKDPFYLSVGYAIMKSLDSCCKCVSLLQMLQGT